MNTKVTHTVTTRKVNHHPIRRFFESLLMVFIVILFVVAAFCGGYYAGGNVDIYTVIKKIQKEKKTTTKTETEEVEEEKVDLKESYIANLLPDLLKGFDCWGIEDFANDTKVLANDISSQRAFTIAETNTFYFSGKQVIPLEEYTNEIRKFLGNAYQFYPEKVEYNHETCPQFEYQKDSKEFVRRPNNCSNVCGNNKSIYRIVNAKKNDERIELVVKVLFGSREGTSFYKDYSHMKFITDDPGTVDTAIGQGGEYTFTFKKENGNIVFVSSEPSK